MCSDTESLKSIINCIVDDLFVGSLVKFIIGLTAILFLWGVLKFIKNAGDEKARTEGKELMLWGIIGFFVIFAIWSIVGVVSGSFFNSSSSVSLPQL